MLHNTAWRTSAFRWLTAYAIIFSIGVSVLVAAIVWTVTDTMIRNTDSLMRWQLAYFEAVPDADLPTVVDQRIAFEKTHPNFYGLFDSTGQLVRGDIERVPTTIPTDGNGVTLRDGVRLSPRFGTKTLRVMAQHRYDGRIFVIARDLEPLLETRAYMVRLCVAAAAICLLLSVASGAWLSIRQRRRIRVIHEATLRISHGEMELRLPEGGSDELDMLCHFVNRMLEEVERLMGEVKSATDNIAHDLQMPLSRLRIQLEHLAEHANALHHEELTTGAIQARDEAANLLDRFRAILRIAEVKSLERRRAFGPVDLSALVADATELYEPVAEARNIRWVVDRPQTACVIRGDRALLFEAIGNLLDNALKFTPSKGAIAVRIKATPLGPLLEIRDTGPGIPAEKRRDVMQRFHRESSDTPGTGLGLSVVGAVLRVHDFNMEMVDAFPGTRVTLHCYDSAG